MRIHTVLTCITVLSLTGCSTLRQVTGYQDPSVKAKAVRFLNADFDKIDLALDLDVHNPYKAAATLTGYDYAVKVAGAQVFSGVQESKVSIPAGGDTTVAVPVSLRYADIYKLYGSLANSDTFSYAILSKLKFDAPVIGTVSVPVAHEGELPVVHMPSVGIDSASFKKLSLTGADIALKLKVTNPNAFNLLLNKMTYTLGVNGATWASGTTTKPVTVKEKGDSVIEIPVSLNLLAMKNVYSLLTSSEPLKYDLQSSLDLGTSNPLMKQITLPLSRKGEFKIPR